MSSSEDEDLKLAIALSLRSKDRHEIINIDSEEDEVASEAPKIAKAPSTLNFLGIDRKQMEQDRLARKRKPSLSPPPTRNLYKRSAHGSVKSGKLGQATDLRANPQPLADFGGLSNDKGPQEALFLEGTVKKTWAFGHPRTSEDIKLEELFQKNDLSLAVLSSFQWDVAWLLAKINMAGMISFESCHSFHGTH